jgi:hypothetical protein
MEGKMKKIIAVYDNCGETIDRYTVVLSQEYMPTNRGSHYNCLALSEDPTSPLGFSQFSECVLLTPIKETNHMGKRIRLTDLPKNVQKHVKERLS